MLRIQRRLGESMIISDDAGNEVELRVDRLHEGSVRVSITGSKKIKVLRKELHIARGPAAVRRTAQGGP